MVLAMLRGGVWMHQWEDVRWLTFHIIGEVEEDQREVGFKWLNMI